MTRFLSSAIAASAMVASVLALPDSAAAQQFIRDAEIEHYVRGWVTPIFVAAKLDPYSVEINLIQSDQINAFVANGQRVFLYTGVLQAAHDPLEILGVVAHETGHIEGGHLARTQQALKDANRQAILAFLLSVAAASAAGNGAAVGPAILGGQDMVGRAFLAYTRQQEQAADQAGVTLLIAAGYSPRGLLSFMETMAQDPLQITGPDPYLQTHPLFPERVQALRQRVQGAATLNTPVSARIKAEFSRLQAKLEGFLDPVPKVLAHYPASDTSVGARYARAVAYHRSGMLVQSLSEVDALLGLSPDDPYYLELKGQVLLENGRVADAIAPYARAVKVAPDEPLIRVGLASALIATDDPALMRDAVTQLTTSFNLDNRNSEAWRLLAVAYGRTGDLGQSALASSEQALLEGSKEEAQRFADLASRRLSKGSPGYLRAQDIINFVKKK